MTKHVLPALDDSEQADVDLQARLDKILHPVKKPSRKAPVPGPAWITPSPAKPAKQKQGNLKTKAQRELTSYSANQRWKLAANFAAVKIANETADSV